MSHKIRIIILSILLILIFLFFYKVLLSEKTYQPRSMIGKSVPVFSMENSKDINRRITNQDFSTKEIVVLNFWASWCVPCRIEHPMLIELKKKYKLFLVGINYKDNASNAKKFLNELGDPFDAIGSDPKGEVAIHFGAYGIPETYVIKKNKIVFRHIGPLNQDVVKAIVALK